MSLSEPDRHRLYEHLRQVLDAQDANTLMAHLPPGGWAETATTSDLSTFQSLTAAEIDAVRVELHALIASLRTELGMEMAAVRTELGSEIATVRTELGSEIATVRTELGSEIATVRTELGSEIATVRTEAITNAADLSNDINALRAEMYRAMSSQTRTIVLAFVASNATVLMLALGVARFA